MIKVTKSEKLYKSLKDKVIKQSPGERFVSLRSIMADYSVSQSTVSSAMNRLVEENLLERDIGREMLITDEVLKYKPGADPVYCLAIPDWQSDWYSFVEHCFHKMSKELGYTLEILRYDWREHVPHELPLTKVDGLIVLSGCDDLTVNDVRCLDRFNIPYLFFARDLAGIQVSCVNSDNEYTGALAANHLIELGHKSLAIVISQPKIETIELRIKGFKQMCELRNVDLKIIDCGIVSGDLAVEKVYHKMGDIFKSGNFDFTGLFALSEDSALSILKACYENDLSIPDDLGLVVVGQSKLLDFYYPSLTSVGLGDDGADLVRAAIGILNNVRENPERPFERRLVKSVLTVRDSTVKLK